jgi:hypothetical protein
MKHWQGWGDRLVSIMSQEFKGRGERQALRGGGHLRSLSGSGHLVARIFAAAGGELVPGESGR